MRNTLLRLTVVPAAVALTLAGIVLTSSAATADADPVTGGSSTIDLSLSTVGLLAKSGIVAIPSTPATVSLDQATQTADFAFPVTGGDASTNTLFGVLKHGGSLTLIDGKTRRSVTLTAITFNIEDDTVSATPQGKSTPVLLFDALGDHEYTTSQPETFTASDLQVEAAGAKYLNKSLHTEMFAAGQHVGTFAASFNNSVDAG